MTDENNCEDDDFAKGALLDADDGLIVDKALTFAVESARQATKSGTCCIVCLTVLLLALIVVVFMKRCGGLRNMEQHCFGSLSTQRHA